MVKKANKLRVPSSWDVTWPSEFYPVGAERYLARMDPRVGAIKAVQKNAV